jgi:hypothetical protein
MQLEYHKHLEAGERKDMLEKEVNHFYPIIMAEIMLHMQN